VISSDLIEDLRRVDGYLRPSVRFEQLAQRFLLVEDPDGPDVIRENTSPVPLVEPLPAAVAADLALSLDPREADAGVTALEEMLHAFR